MTTLFNLFCPLISIFSAKWAINILMAVSILTLFCLAGAINTTVTSEGMTSLSKALFPLSSSSVGIMVAGFLLLAILNLISLVCYSFPVTTVLSFNISMALSLWLSSILFMLFKTSVGGVILPSNSPWYLAPFLSLVELISIVVRPITLCFRLLANMSAGHVLLTLICKMTYGLWLLGVLFGVLELMVSFVQAFVFLMLTTVYLEEAFSH